VGVLQTLEDLLGEWTGEFAMRMMPDDEFVSCPAAASLEVTAGSLVSVRYRWSNADGPQDGLLLVGDGSAPHEARGIWVDSFHQSPHWMALQGAAMPHEVVLEGVYPAPRGPDWGWRIRLRGVADWQLTMVNMPAEGVAYEVVRASFSK
jgi:hypothetical protein